MISSRRRLFVPLAVFGSAFALNACSSEVSVGDDKVSAANLETEASDSLTKKFGQEPASIDCPDDLDAEVDATETCELVDQAGNHYDMKVTITSVDEDGNANFHIDVGNVKQISSTPQ